MSYLNQPNRLYISSDDTQNSSEHSGHFNIRLNDPIMNAKTVSVVSCEYPSSFYNVSETDVFYFDEVYYVDGIEVKRIRFSLSGLPEDNYTSAELAVTISTRASYLTTNPVLVGIDTNPYSSDITGVVNADTLTIGKVVPSGVTDSETYNRMYLKRVVVASSTAPKRFRSLNFQIAIGTFSLVNFGTAFLLKKLGSIFKLIMTAELNSDTYNATTRTCKIDFFDKKVDIGAYGADYYVGIVLPPAVSLDKVSSTVSDFVYYNAEQGNVNQILNSAISGNSITILDKNLTFAPTHTGGSEPNFYVELTPIYNYSYNIDNASNYLKASITVSHDDGNKRFSIIPNKHAQYTLSGGGAGSDNAIPFYKTAHTFGLTSYSNSAGALVSSLEIPNMNNTKGSINYKIGARSHKLPYTVSTNLSANIALRFPSIPRLIQYPYVYLTCDFINDSKKSGLPISNILQKLPLTSDYGYTNFFNVSSADANLACFVSRDNLQTMNFKILSSDNKEIDMNGGELSFTLNFEYN